MDSKGKGESKNNTLTFTSEQDESLEIRTLPELLDALIDIPQEQIDSTMRKNLPGITQWIADSHPDQLHLLAGLNQTKDEYTPQQTREELIRELQALNTAKESI